MTDIKTSGDSAREAGEYPAVAEWVASILRERIVKGEIGPGRRIVERKLSTELNVSRTPIREALKLLNSEGLVDILRNRGAQVTSYDSQEARDLFDVIAALESTAARRFVERITPETLDRLEELHASMLTFYKIGSFENYFDTNSEIHDLIVQESGNPVLAETHGRLMARARRGRFLAIMEPARLRQAVEEHENLMEVVRAGDALGAGSVWHTHLFHTGETVAAALNRVGDQARDQRSSATS